VDSVVAADWARDRSLAVLISSAETPGWISRPRISPDGDRIAFFDHRIFPDDRGKLVVIDRNGVSKAVTQGFASCQGIAWRPDGGEIWFSVARAGTGAEICAATLDGKVRTVAGSPGGMRITDIAPDGRVLFVRDNHRAELHAFAPGESEERDLSWGDWSVVADLSDDGRTVLFSEQGDAVGAEYAVCIRGTDGSPVVRLGGGSSMALSPDGRYALATTLDTPTELIVLPIGAGQPKKLPRGSIRSHFGAAWLPDGKGVFAIGEDSTGAVKGYVQDVAGGGPRAVIEDVDFTVGLVQLTPDGRYAAISPLRKLHSLTGAPPMDIPGIAPSERFFCAGFGRDGREIFASPLGSRQPTIVAIDLKSGARRVIRSISPRNPAGILSVALTRVNGDATAIAFGVDRNISEVYVAKGLR
jgi:Tol biopolymer transport system component